MSSVNKRTLLLIAWLAILGVLYSVVTHYSAGGGPAPPPPLSYPKPTSANLQAQWSQIAAHAAAPPLGSAHTPYTLIEFGDFQCPQCGKMRPVLEAVLKKYPAEVNLLFDERPFKPTMHRWARQAAQASLAAAAQGKFWPMYNILYSHQDDLEPGFYNNYAAAAGLNVKTFAAALAANTYRTQVQQDIAFDRSLKIDVTPTVLLRNNKTGAITIYMGADSSASGAIPGFQGITQMVQELPWLSAGGIHTP